MVSPVPKAGVCLAWFLLLVLFADSVFCAPRHLADSWRTRGARGRKVRMLEALKRSLEPRRQHGNTTDQGFPSPTIPKPVGGCPEKTAKSIQAPKNNVWLGLTDEEVASVTEWLFYQEEFNLTRSYYAWDWDNTVLIVDLVIPNKTDVLNYLDGNSSAPARYAHVTLDSRVMLDAHYQDIMVGPLPIDNTTTTWQPLEYSLTRKTEGKVRNLDADQDILYDNFFSAIGTDIENITLALFNGTTTGSDNDTMVIWGIDPYIQDDGRVIRWDTFWNNPIDDFHAGSILPLGLFIKTDVTGRDPKKWQVLEWLYNGTVYNSTEAFKAAWENGEIQPLGINAEGEWARTDQQGDMLPMDDAAPPIQVAPSGPRYWVDVDNQYVEWMAFSFYLGFSRDTGLSLYDIRFKGERILYELGLQEALAHYAGNDPVQSGTAYLDSFYGFGPYTFELVSGYDCPTYATYLNSTFYMDETTHTHVNSICLFENDPGFVIQRHTTDKYVAVTKNIQFVVRSCATLGNYDYTISYTFSLDGTISVEVRASGYIQGGYYAGNGGYGFKIHDFLSGSMHDHVLNFKADFDILGTSNTAELVKVTPVQQEYNWSGGKTRNTMALERSSVVSEDESRFNWDPNAQTQLIIINTDHPNRFGELRGYRVVSTTPPVHLTVQNSSNLGDAANWASYDVQITAQKDTEPRSAHRFNNQDVHNPPINFDAFFDSENLLQTDLVLWVNFGMHHVPHTGDLPNTVMTTAYAGISFTPSNYLDSDASRQTVNMVRIPYTKGKATKVETFGQLNSQCPVDYTPIVPDYSGYTGDIVVRKFPYDPNNPFFETESIS